ncbi:MAG: SEC-C domain-containing protein [Clostridia bacterium]|nr:SEC-C domain-containing protein [Clostridia bacterium]
MLEAIKRDTVRYVLAVKPRPQVEIKRVQVAKPIVTAGDGSLPKQAKKADNKPGRNDPCPCGSGKKYKQCCGK